MALRRWIATLISLLAGCFFAVGYGVYWIAIRVAGLHNEPTDGSDEY